MAIVFTILKVIGIILLCLLGLLILLLLIVLLSPLTYSLTGCYHSQGQTKVLANINYLFRMLRFDLIWDGKEVRFRIKLLWFNLKKGAAAAGIGKAKTDEGVKKEEKDNLAEEAGTIEDRTSEAVDTAESISKDDAEGMPDKPPSDFGNSPARKEDDWDEAEFEKEILKEGILPEPKVISSEDKPDKGQGNKVESVIQKATELHDQIETILDKLNEPSMIRLRRKLFKGFKKVLLHLLPSSLDINGEFGLEDPYLMGKISEVSAFCHAFYGDHIRLLSDFERQHIDIKGRLKGRIIVGYLLYRLIWMVLAILLQKDARQFISKKIFHKS